MSNRFGKGLLFEEHYILKYKEFENNYENFKENNLRWTHYLYFSLNTFNYSKIYKNKNKNSLEYLKTPLIQQVLYLI